MMCTEEKNSKQKEEWDKTNELVEYISSTHYDSVDGYKQTNIKGKKSEYMSMIKISKMLRIIGILLLLTVVFISGISLERTISARSTTIRFPSPTDPSALSMSPTLTVFIDFGKKYFYVAPRPFINSATIKLDRITHRIEIPIQLEQNVTKEIQEQISTNYNDICPTSLCHIFPLPINEVRVKSKGNFLYSLNSQWQSIHSSPSIKITYPIDEQNNLSVHFLVEHLELQYLINNNDTDRQQYTNIIISGNDILKLTGNNPLNEHVNETEITTWTNKIMYWIEEKKLKENDLIIASMAERERIEKLIQSTLTRRTIQTDDSTLKLYKINKYVFCSNNKPVMNLTIAILHQSKLQSLLFIIKGIKPKNTRLSKLR